MVAKAASTTRKHAQIAGVSTTFLDVGCGRSIVALHGIPTSSALFEPLLPHLAGYRLIAPDLIGQGGTGMPVGGRLDHAAYKEHLAAFLATVPPDEFDLIVHDLGGVLGLEWAADHPQRVRRIIVLSTGVTWSFRVGFLLHAANLLFGTTLLRLGLPWTLKGHGKLEPSLVGTWAAPWTRRRLLRGLDLFAPAHLARLRAKLGHIQAPVLLIWGREDNVFPLSFARGIVERLPQSKLVTIGRCGHWSPLDAGEDVARYILEFLAAAR